MSEEVANLALTPGCSWVCIHGIINATKSVASRKKKKPSVATNSRKKQIASSGTVIGSGRADVICSRHATSSNGAGIDHATAAMMSIGAARTSTTVGA